MNEQIEKIYGEACIHYGYLDEREFCEKFAQLIARECAEVVTKFAKEWCREGESPDYGYERVIKEHFGVE